MGKRLGTLERIVNKFPVTEDEYDKLNTKFGDLCEYAAWQLYKKNSKNNHTDDQSDIAQDLRIALLRAGSYYKRQVYIEDCLELCGEYADDGFLKLMIEELQQLWKNKTRHGANRQKFGPHQEEILEKITITAVPGKQRPSKIAPLRMDSKFNTYCKAITWNAQKAMGKKITREKAIRQGQVSLSEFDYLGAVA